MAESALKFTWAEQIVCVIARDLRDEDSVQVGGARHDIPYAAVSLARLLYAPDMTIFTTSLFWNPELPPLRHSGQLASAFTLMADAKGSGYDIFESSEKGVATVFFYSGLQIDRYGNINLHFVGDPRDPVIRGPGVVNPSRGVSAKRFYIYAMRHEKRTLVEKVDFISIAGHIDGPDGRRKAGIKTSGPGLCVTPLAVFDFDESTKAMRLKSVHQGVSVEQVMENTGFQPIIPREVTVTPPPTAEELELLHTRIDPDGVLRR
ncbi:MAG: CoA synthetase [Chloroflexi bacterium]|nr:CoA synthetase [Chloroflexota bacterium]